MISVYKTPEITGHDLFSFNCVQVLHEQIDIFLGFKITYTAADPFLVFIVPHADHFAFA